MPLSYSTCVLTEHPQVNGVRVSLVSEHRLRRPEPEQRVLVPPHLAHLSPSPAGLQEQVPSVDVPQGREPLLVQETHSLHECARTGHEVTSFQGGGGGGDLYRVHSSHASFPTEIAAILVHCTASIDFIVNNKNAINSQAVAML